MLCDPTQLLLANFENYFNRFASLIRGGILDDFKFCYQFTTLSNNSVTSAAINNLLKPELRHCSSTTHDDPMGAPSALVARNFNLKYSKEAGEDQTG